MASSSNASTNSDLSALDSQLRQILHECQQDGMTQEEMRVVFAPLVTHLTTLAQQKDGGGGGKERVQGRRRWYYWLLPCLFITLALFGLMAGVGLLPGMASNGSGPDSSIGTLPSLSLGSGPGPAIGGLLQSIKSEITSKALVVTRLILVKLLPYWNWTDLYYARCLVRNPYYQDTQLGVDDCNLCENLDDIEVLSNVTQTQILEEYLRRERPFIVQDAMLGWPAMEPGQFWFDNVTELFLPPNPNGFYVCNLNTNLRPASTAAKGTDRSLAKLIQKLPHIQQWYVHWENCQKEAAKAVRQFYRRPYFISNSLDFTGSNWVLMSSDFHGRVYKRIEVGDSLSLLYQLRGVNHIRLSPRDVCRGYCPELMTTLREGEVLVVTHFVWVLEYIPGAEGDNLAVLSEVSWSNSE